MTKRFGALHRARRRVAAASSPARSTRCSARTAPARARWSSASWATTSADAGAGAASTARGRRSPARATRARWASAWSTSTSRWSTSMTVAENLVLARADVPAVIDWARGARGARRVHGDDAVPRRRSTRRCAQLAAGEKQKLEILKQLYLRQPHRDPRRADLGADAAGGRRGARPAARHGAERAS